MQPRTRWGRRGKLNRSGVRPSPTPAEKPSQTSKAAKGPSVSTPAHQSSRNRPTKPNWHHNPVFENGNQISPAHPNPLHLRRLRTAQLQGFAGQPLKEPDTEPPRTLHRSTTRMFPRDLSWEDLAIGNGPTHGLTAEHAAAVP
jgi:hypothetical protein